MRSDVAFRRRVEGCQYTLIGFQYIYIGFLFIFIGLQYILIGFQYIQQDVRSDVGLRDGALLGFQIGFCVQT